MNELSELKRKIARFCAWRDRCSIEVEKKLYELEATPLQTKELMKWLNDEKFLDDARFAKSYAYGKFSQNHWGKLRIIAELRHRALEQELINEALKNISENEYTETLESLAGKKFRDIKSNDLFIKKQKTAAYLSSKGFENDLIWKTVETIAQKG